MYMCMYTEGWHAGIPQQACDVLAEWHINGCVCYFKCRNDDGLTYGCLLSVILSGI